MNSHPNIDDPTLTAYAVGELGDRERREVEARLATDPAARQFVDNTRATARLLTRELAAEQLAVPRERASATARRWPGRGLMATAACLVVGGMTVYMLLPSLNRARDTASPTRLAQIRQQHHQQQQQSMPTEQSHTLPAGPSWSYQNAPAVPAPAPMGAATEVQPSAPNRAPGALKKEVQAAQSKLGVARGYGWQPGNERRDMSGLAANVDLTERQRRQLPEELAEIRLQQGQAAASMQQVPAGRPINGVVRNRRNIAGVEYATISVGSADDVAKGMQFRVIDRDSGQFLGMLTVEAVDPNEASGRLAGPRIADIRPGVEVRTHYEDVAHNTEAYARIVDNPFLEVATNPLSTFSIDVDTASYANVRRFLNQGQLPPPDAVRIEELVNYFPYGYLPPPAEPEAPPFTSHVEVAECPWAAEHRLVRVALKGKEIASHERPASNLVFLIDVSGSMNEPNKLPLVKESMSRLVEKLGANDRVAVVVYAGSSGMVLDSTVATPRNKRDILAALDRLQAGGSTNGGQGIELAYATAASRFIEGGVNRVILCTDGDFNVGVTDQGSLTRLIEEKAKSGVFLSVLGFGMGNVKDATMEQLADKGNGNYAYIDTILEGHKVLVEQMSGTLVTIAKDVKIQVEFNPAAAGGYRLIGYENRLLAKEDFNDDKKDAGEIGAGHTVTALYEVVPAGRKVDGGGAVDPLKYQAPATRPAAQQQPFADELLTLKLRYKQPDGDTSKLLEFPVKNAAKRFADTSGDFKFAAGVAGFGMILRDSPHKGSATLGAVLEWAGEGVGADEHGYRAEFVELVKKAKGLKPE